MMQRQIETRPACPACQHLMVRKGFEWTGVAPNRHKAQKWVCPACGRMRVIRLTTA